MTLLGLAIAPTARSWPDSGRKYSRSRLDGRGRRRAWIPCRSGTRSARATTRRTDRRDAPLDLATIRSEGAAVSDETEPGEGNSPAAWVAVIIMLVAIAGGTLAFWFDVPWLVWSCAGLVVVGALVGGDPASKLGLRRQRAPATRRRCIPRVLSDLVAGAVADASERRAVRRLAQVEADALARPPALDVMAALAPAERVKIIAEVKRASPSRGRLADIADPASLAVSYQTGGASAISVLTEGRRVPRVARRPRGGPRRRRHPGAAQGLHRRPVPGVRGASRGSRPRAADRRGARTAAARRACTR